MSRFHHRWPKVFGGLWWWEEDEGSLRSWFTNNRGQYKDRVCGKPPAQARYWLYPGEARTAVMRKNTYKYCREDWDHESGCSERGDRGGDEVQNAEEFKSALRSSQTNSRKKEHERTTSFFEIRPRRPEGARYRGVPLVHEARAGSGAWSEAWLEISRAGARTSPARCTYLHSCFQYTVPIKCSICSYLH